MAFVEKAFSVADDYYYDDDGFDNYEVKTVDPGPWFLVGVLIYSLLCIISIPILVIFGKRRERRRQILHQWTDSGSSAFDGSVISEHSAQSGVKEGFEVEINTSSKKELAIIDISASPAKRRKAPTPLDLDHERQVKFAQNGQRFDQSPLSPPSHHEKSSVAGESVMSTPSSIASGRSYRRGGKRSKRGKSKIVATFDMYQRVLETEGLYHIEDATARERTLGSRPMETESGLMKRGDEIADEIGPEDAADANDPGKEKAFQEPHVEVGAAEMTICCGPNALFSRKTFGRGWDVLVDIANPDRETQRLLQLGIPLTLSEVSEAMYDAVSVALISHYLGVNALSAYVVTHLLLGLSETCIHGVGDSLNTVCAHAIGADNYFLAGQYVQIAGVLYLLFAIPVMGVWWFVMGPCISLFGLDDSVAEMGAQYTKIVIFHYVLDGVFEAYTGLLDLVGYALQATIFDLVAGTLEVALLWIALAKIEGFDLFWIGVFQLSVGAFFLLLFTLIAIFLGWLQPFMTGLTRSFALKNKDAVIYVLKQAIPLSIGSVLEYGEWEALTFFAAALGPAEVAAWGILEAVWDLFESATEGLSEAASIRLAFHLGKGNIETAKRSSWKSLFLSSVLAILITSIFFICGDSLPGWFTDDETLQEMLISMIPLVGIGNILMIFGMVSWSLVGAQGRFKLATGVSAVMTFFVTIPLASIFCIGFHFSLDALVGAVVIGYSTTGLVLAYILLMSDWEHISRTIVQQNAEQYGSDSESSSEDSSSSSSDESSSSNNEELPTNGQ